MMESLVTDTDMCTVKTQIQAFVPHHLAAKTFLAEELGVGLAEVVDYFEESWRRSQNLFRVQPDWMVAETTRLFKLKYPARERDNTMWSTFQTKLMAAYDEPIHLYPDVLPTFKGLIKLGIQIGSNSNAEGYWTDKKRIWNPELSACLVYGLIYGVRSKDPKTDRSWIRTLDFYGFPINTSAAVGDSISSDVIPAMKAGIPRVYYLDRPDEPHYGPSRQGDVPPGAIIIESLLEILEDARAERNIYLV